MKLHSITLHNVRAVEHLELTGIPDSGVVLISGDNESGKSTVLDALDVALNFKHSSKDRRVKVLAPAGRDVGPEVELSATVGPYTFTIRKVFLKKPSSELTITAPRNEQFAGRSADEKLEAILDEHLDATLASTLFLRQGELDPGIAAAGIPAITRALDADAASDEGGAAGASGTEDTALMARIEAEYGRYYTAKGGKKSSFTALEKAAEEAEEVLSGLRADVARLSGYVDEVANREADIAGISAELPQAVAEETARAQDAAAAEALAHKVAGAQTAARRAEVDLKRAQDDVEARAAARERLAGLKKEADELASQLVEAREAAAAEAGRIAELTEARDRAREDDAAARAAMKEAEAHRERVRSRVRAAELGDVIARLDAADEEIASLRSRQPTQPVKDADVRAVEKAREEVSLQRRLRDAAAAKLEIRGPESTQVSVDGDKLDFAGSAAVGVHDGTRVHLNGVEVTYRAAHGADDGGEALARAERALTELLDGVGCEDLDEVRRLRDAHSDLAASLQAALRRREDILSARDAEELRAEHARILQRVDGDDAPDTASESEAEQALNDARDAAESAATALEQAEAALKPWAEKKGANALAVLEARADSKAGEVSAAEADMAAAEEKSPHAELEAALRRAQQARDSAAAESAEYEKQLAEADPDLVKDLLEGAQVRVRNLRERLVEAEKKVAELSGRIEQATGVAEQADRAEAQFEAAQAVLAAETRRAQAARLLRETMLRHRDEARARYAAPFAEALNRYASRVFGPDVHFTLGESLEIEARTLRGTTVALEQLSGGAKEQLALLVRFAIAELAGHGPAGRTTAPVIVDDALGATDAGRLERMNSLLNTVGKQSQVFVLTCFPRRFDWIRPTKEASISELKQAPQ